ncbi:MAG: ABC transporter substrate-binding protein, partial [Clostridia bacterium]|nr:ABC transporter substrate-binding protein [Clostridia bacterium]
MKKRILVFILAITLLLSGCSASSNQVSPISGNTLTDCAGREVPIPENTDRIACLYAYTGHVCVILGCEDNIVAVVNGLKRDQLMQRKIPQIADMACPYNSGSINIEELAAVNPNVVFLRVENLADSGEKEKLDSVGIPYVVVDYVT